MSDCGHPLCALIGGACSIATRRSRGCRPNLAAKTIASAVFDEIRALLVAIDRGERDAAVRLAEIIRREARDDRMVLGQARIDEPELVPALERLCLRAK